MTVPALTEEEAREAVRLMKEQAPDIYQFMVELYNEGMIDGARAIEYLKIGDREFGEYHHPAPPLIKE